jgi:hypothetical protein
MNSKVIRAFARVTVPMILGGAALAVVGVAAAGAQSPTEPSGPGYNYSPTVTATPAAEAPWNKHGVARVEELVPGYTR